MIFRFAHILNEMRDVCVSKKSLRKEMVAINSSLGTRTQTSGKFRTLLKTSFKRYTKPFVIGLIIGILVMVPFMFRPSYERLDVEYYTTTDDLLYTAFYSQFFDEPSPIPSPHDDVVMVCLMNVTESKIVLIAVEFEGNVDITRVGVLQDDTKTLMYDMKTPQYDLSIQLLIEDVGIYYCGVFIHPIGEYSVNIDVIYLS